MRAKATAKNMDRHQREQSGYPPFWLFILYALCVAISPSRVLGSTGDTKLCSFGAVEQQQAGQRSGIHESKHGMSFIWRIAISCLRFLIWIFELPFLGPIFPPIQIQV